MRSHVTLVALLVVGILMSASGTALAFQGFGQSGNDASKAQYPDGTSGPSNEPDRPGGPGVGGPNLPERPTIAPQDVLSDTSFGSVPDDTVPRQIEAGSTLPFTGFVAIPVLVLGVALVLAGLALRRQAPRG